MNRIRHKVSVIALLVTSIGFLWAPAAFAAERQEWMGVAVPALENELVGTYGEEQRRRIQQGLDQVAEVLDLPRSTVYSRLQAAVGAIRAALEADGRSVAHAIERQEVLR